MSVSIEQAAANLSAALSSGLEQDAVSAQASYAEAIADVDPEDVPAPALGPIKRELSAPEDEA